MSDNYETLEIKIVYFRQDDIVRTSDGGVGDNYVADPWYDGNLFY